MAATIVPAAAGGEALPTEGTRGGGGLEIVIREGYLARPAKGGVFEKLGPAKFDMGIGGLFDVLIHHGMVFFGCVKKSVLKPSALGAK